MEPVLHLQADINMSGGSMKKFLVSIAAVAALAIAPTSALASPGQWGGWSSAHQDDATSVSYWTTQFGHNGAGNSQYCLGASPCLPVVFSGVFAPAGTPVAGCGAHELAGGQATGPTLGSTVPSGGRDPCAHGNLGGGVFVRTFRGPAGGRPPGLTTPGRARGPVA